METQTEEIRCQVEVDPDVGHSHKGLLEPKSDIETLMDTNAEAECSNKIAQPTNTTEQS